MNREKEVRYELSLTIPAYNEAPSIPKLINHTLESLSGLDITSEILIVDDGSTDDTTEVVARLIRKHNNKSGVTIRYIPLTRNFGKEAAILAGFSQSTGKIVGSMDADGQHPPEEIPNMLKILKTNEIDLVVGVRSDQKHKRIGFLSTVFYKLNKSFGNDHLISNGTDFRFMKEYVVKDFLSLREHNRINRELIDWIGYRAKIYTFTVKERIAGTASYSFSKLLNLALNGLFGSSTKPLLILLPIGLILTFISIFTSFVLVTNYLLNDPLTLNVSAQGYFVVFSLFIFGVILMTQGVLAIYVGRIFNEVRNRPNYIIDMGRII